MYPSCWVKVPFFLKLGLLLIPFLNFGCELMLFFNFAWKLMPYSETVWKFWWAVLRFSGWVGQTVSEYRRLGDRQFQIFWTNIHPCGEQCNGQRSLNELGAVTLILLHICSMISLWGSLEERRHNGTCALTKVRNQTNFPSLFKSVFAAWKWLWPVSPWEHLWRHSNQLGEAILPRVSVCQERRRRRSRMCERELLRLKKYLIFRLNSF